MKRSEMIEVLVDALTDFKLFPKIYSKTKQAEYLLLSIEEAGMLPPSAKIKIGDTEYTDNCWEKE